MQKIVIFASVKNVVFTESLFITVSYNDLIGWHYSCKFLNSDEKFR
jgi:hypothetical protein